MDREETDLSGPEQIAEGVYRVDAIPIPSAVSVLLVRESGGFTLVDTGVSSSPKRIRAALSQLGAGPSDLKRIFLTHYHDDHTGGLNEMVEWAGAEVWASDRESEILTGERPPDKSANPLLKRMMGDFQPPKVEIARRLRDGGMVAGFRTVPTPGHTLGHVSLLRDADGLLFTADAFGCLPLKVRVGVRKAFCTDPALAKRSASDLLAEPFETVVFSHGKPVRSGAKEKLRRVVAECDYV